MGEFDTRREDFGFVTQRHNLLTPIDPLKLSTFIPNFAYVAQNADGQLKIKHGKNSHSNL